MKLLNNSCDLGSGNGHSAYETWLFTMNKPTDVPAAFPAEVSTPVGWALANATILAFQGTINSASSFAGRQVAEGSDGAPNFDDCWFPGSQIPYYGLSGGGWWVGYDDFESNNYIYDFIGFFADSIEYYRAYNQTPCSVAAGQNMFIYKNFVSAFELHKHNTLEISLPDNTYVGVARDGQWGWRQWGITTTSLPRGMQGQGYTTALGASVGPTPYGYSIFSGGLPLGLGLGTNGVITGTPTTAISANFTVQVTDSVGQSSTRALSITVDPPLLITTTSLPPGVVGTPYAQTLSATGGTTPYTWSLASGGLPPGLLLNSSGVIAGTPTLASISNFTVRVTDNNARIATQPLSITVIDSPPPLPLVSGQLVSD